MKAEQLFAAIGQVEESLLERSEAAKRRHRRPGWLGGIAAALAVAVLAGVVFRPVSKSADLAAPQAGESQGALAFGELAQAAPAMDEAAAEAMEEPIVTLLAAPVLPERAPYPQEGTEEAYRLWRSAKPPQLTPEIAQSLQPFFRTAIPALLEGAPGENRVCSPVNVYLALGMLTQITGGDSRAQVLQALGEPSAEALAARAQEIWNACYRLDGITDCALAGSLWLREDVSYNPETLQGLSDRFYASTYRGTMGSPEVNAALSNWLEEQTRGQLSPDQLQVDLSPRTMLAIATTVLYQAQWQERFLPENTTQALFQGAKGAQQVPFMHAATANTYYWGEHFGAVALPLANEGGRLWLVLPEEGSTPEALLTEETLDFLLCPNSWEQKEACTVELAMPRFELNCSVDLEPVLKGMGITEVFDLTRSDFTPLTTEEAQLSLAETRHELRFAANEEGVSAAAMTLLVLDRNGLAPQERVAFTLDRPFLFLLEDANGLPLFAGIVNSCQG